MEKKNPLRITETILRDAHQSQAATRMRIEDMLPACELLDNMGYWSLECWGGATFDVCMRFLNEDPWERLRTLKAHMPKTKLQMLFRGQNILGYKHYADDVVEEFCQKSIENGIDVVRVFDALNDIRNLRKAVESVKKYGGWAEVALSYTVSPVHNDDYFVGLAKDLEKMGADSICIKDMANLLLPLHAYDLVRKLKDSVSVPIHLHTHNTAGTGDMVNLMACQAGVDIVDCALSPLANGTSQPATESLVATLQGSDRDTGLDLGKLNEAATHFRKVADKLKKEGFLDPKVLQVDTKALMYQVPGGMLSNMLGQLKQAGQEDRYYDVLAEVPRVRKDFGYPPLVTPTSQIVGTQAVMNIVAGERYKMVPKESKGLLRGEYGKLPGKVNEEVRRKCIGDDKVITCRPADLLKPELAQLEADVKRQAQEKGITLAENAIDDVLTVALFPQPGLKFLENRHNPAAFEPVPQAEAAQPVAKAEKPAASGVYTVEVEGKAFVVKVSDGGDVSQLTAAAPAPASAPAAAAPAGAGTPVTAPLAGTIWKVLASEGQTVAAGEVLLILEAMKMETEIRAAQAGTVRGIAVKAGDAVAVGDTLMTLA